MWQRWKRLRTGEKILFGLVAFLILITIQNYAYLEYLRRTSDHPMFPIRTHYDFAGEGFRGSELFRKNNCTACHRAVGNGTNMGLNLDGIGSRRSLAYLEDFLRDPEATYPSRTLDHGPAPKEAAYVAALSADDRRAIAVFLSQLTSDRGGVESKAPPGSSSFIDAMLDMWAPDSWRMLFSDVRDSDKKKAASQKGTSQSSSTQASSPGQTPGTTPPAAQPQGNPNEH